MESKLVMWYCKERNTYIVKSAVDCSFGLKIL